MKLKRQNKLWRDIESKSVDEVICDWNINRLFCTIVIVIALQFINLLNKTSYIYTWHLYNIIVIFTASLLGILVFGLLYYKPGISVKAKRRIHQLCWFILPILFIPFFYKNALLDTMPITLFMASTALATLPLLNFKETLITFIPIILSNAFIIIYCECDTVYCAYTIVSIVAGLFVSVSIHGRAIQLLKQLGTLCTYDPMTKVLNKNAGYQRATNMYEMCKRTNQPFAVFMIDIDFFKAYNDTFGHQTGDTILKEISSAISNTFTRKQDIVCRYGGEEFMVCISNQNASDFEYMADVLLENIYELRIESANKTVSPYVTISAGFSVFTAEDKKNDTVLSLDELIKKADQALYKAKASGRNQFCKA